MLALTCRQWRLSLPYRLQVERLAALMRTERNAAGNGMPL